MHPCSPCIKVAPPVVWSGCKGCDRGWVSWLLCSRCCADLSAWDSPRVHRGAFATGKTSSYLEAYLIHHPISSLSFTFTPIPASLSPRLVPPSTPGGLKKISPALTPQEPATYQPIISQNLWSMLRAVQVTLLLELYTDSDFRVCNVTSLSILLIDVTAVLLVGDQ